MRSWRVSSLVDVSCYSDTRHFVIHKYLKRTEKNPVEPLITFMNGSRLTRIFNKNKYNRGFYTRFSETNSISTAQCIMEKADNNIRLTRRPLEHWLCAMVSVARGWRLFTGQPITNCAHARRVPVRTNCYNAIAAAAAVATAIHVVQTRTGMPTQMRMVRGIPSNF